MNKTVKTLAWICLVLGLLGLAMDGVVFVKGRALVAQVKEKIASGDFPAAENHFKYFDEENDFDSDNMGAWRTDRSGKFGFGGMRGRRGGPDRMGRHGGLVSNRSGMFALPLLFLASGPVLTVVGAVMLIVNREPKKKAEEGKKIKKSK